MLGSDKKILSQILRKLYADYKYFQISDEGNVFFKKRWFSVTKHTTSLKELAADTLPTVISSYSEVDSANYQTDINQILTNNFGDTQIVEFINTTFSNLLRNYKFAGISPIVYRLDTLKTKKINQAKKSSKLKTFINDVIFHIRKKKTEISTKIVSVEEKVNESLTYASAIVGRVCTGDKDLDAKYRTIVRYISPEAGIYCI